MHPTPRYAIYFVPREGTRLAEFGDTLFAGARPASVLAGVAPAGWNAAPLRYGFHATLKAPFHVCPSRGEPELEVTARRVGSAHPGFVLPRLVVTLIDDFVALTAVSPPPNLGRLADACVRDFQPMAASLTPDDRARRLADGLSLQEIAYLDAWGYPYIFDHFQFHMSLTGPLAREHAEPLQRALAQHYASFDAPVEIDAITICRQPNRDADFAVWQRFDLACNPG